MSEPDEPVVPPEPLVPPVPIEPLVSGDEPLPGDEPPPGAEVLPGAEPGVPVLLPDVSVPELPLGGFIAPPLLVPVAEPLVSLGAVDPPDEVPPACARTMPGCSCDVGAAAGAEAERDNASISACTIASSLRRTCASPLEGKARPRVA